MTMSPPSLPTRRQFLRGSALATGLVAVLPYVSLAAAARVSVRDHGAKGDGRSNDTAAFRKAITAVPKGGIVVVPAGTYLLDGSADRDTAVRLKSDMKLELQAGARLLTKPNALPRHYLLWVDQADNVEIYGIAGKDGALPELVGERGQHRGTEGEWGQGIRVQAASNVTIRNVLVRDFWGDGMTIAGLRRKGLSPIASKNITVSGVQCRNNRRQGLSIINVLVMQVTDSEFSGTKGTKPEDGIDIEPDQGDTVRQVTIKNCRCIDNNGHGIEIYGKVGVVDGVTISGCTLTGNWRSGMYGQYASNVRLLDNPAIANNGQAGVVVRSTLQKVTVRGNRFSNNLLRGGSNGVSQPQFRSARMQSLSKGACSPKPPTKGYPRHVLKPAQAPNLILDGNTYCD